MKKFLINNKEIIKYIIGGGMTTAINLIVFFFLNNVVHTHYLFANFMSIVISIVVAFFINKFFVFPQVTHTLRALVKEFLLFCGFRAITGLFDMTFIALFVSWMGINSNLAKLLTEVTVVALNYVFSKFFVFK